MSELMDFVNVELKKRKIRKIDFAEGIGVSRPAIHAWEIDAAQPIDENVKKIADFLDIPFSKLIAMRSGVENEEPETEKPATPEGDGKEESQLIKIARQLEQVSIRFALYGDAAEDVTDDDLEAIREYARYIRSKRK